MKLPICEVDLKSGILCSSCEEKLRSGQISRLEFDVCSVLFQLFSEGKVPQTLTFLKAIEIPEIIVIVVGRGDVQTLVRSSATRTLNKHFKKKVRVIENTQDPKRFLPDLLYPAHILGINIVYLPEGKTQYKIRIPTEDEIRLPASRKSIQDFITQLTGQEMGVAFE
jgi:transcription antitermination factor NusA-like protein